MESETKPHLSTYSVYGADVVITFFDDSKLPVSLLVNFEFSKDGNISENTEYLIMYSIDELTEYTSCEELDFTAKFAIAKMINAQYLFLAARLKLDPDQKKIRMLITHNGLHKKNDDIKAIFV
jgi:hypothetical protein